MKTSLSKFLSEKTTVSQFKRKQPTAPLPMVVVCPQNAYKLNLMEPNNMTVFIPHHQNFSKWPSQENFVEKAWLIETCVIMKN